MSGRRSAHEEQREGARGDSEGQLDAARGVGRRMGRRENVAGCRTSMSLSAPLAHTMTVRIGASVGTPLVLLTMGMHCRAVIVRKYMYGNLENSSNRILGAKFHQE